MPLGGPLSTLGGFIPRGPEILVGSFNQTWLVNCLRRRWLMATLMGLLVGLAAAGLLMWLFPPSSRITSYLEVKPDSAVAVFESKRVVSPLEVEREAAMHPALIKSPLVLHAALLGREDIANLDAVQYHKGEEVLWLINELKVTFATDSPILEVRYEGEESPEDMKKIVDAVIKSYQDNVLMRERVTRSATQNDLRIILNEVKDELKRKLDALRIKAGDTGGSLNFEEYYLPKLRNDIALYQKQLMDIENDLIDIEVLKNVSFETARSPAALEAAVNLELDKDPRIALYQQQLFDIELQISELSASTRNRNNAQLRRLEAQRQQTAAAMAQHRQLAGKEIRDRLEQLPNEALRAAITEYQVRFKALTEAKDELETKLADAEGDIEEMSVGDPETEMLKQDIESQQELVLSLEQQILQGEVSIAAQDRKPETEFEKVQVIQKAEATEKINIYERWAIAGIGGFAALAITCYAVALIDFRRRKLNGPTDMDEGLGIRVLGVLPPASLKTLAGNSLVATQVAEGIDNVRATIMHDSTSRPRQIVMVTSPRTMEGATTVAASLALSLSRAGRRTLLVDGDLRAPSLHKLFGLPLEDGLSEVLRAEIDLADAVRPTTNEGLYLLTAGVCDMDAIYALATDQPQPIFDKLRDQFDFVVIDSPPVLGIADSLSLGQYVDGAILTVLRDHSEIRSIYQASEVLRSMGVRLIGTVVNGVPTKADRRVVRLHQAAAQRTPRLPAKAAEE
jgi:capsular exopolysaccharide synthesis family protein